MIPLIYTKIEQQHLEEIIECLHFCLELPVQLLDESGTVLCQYGTNLPFCTCFGELFSRYAIQKDSCSELHAQASRQSLKTGKPYIFYCHACLTHLIFPLSIDKQPLGSILIGPFLNSPLDADAIADISQRYKFNARDLLKLYKASVQIKIISPEKTEQIGWLLFHLTSPLLSASQTSCPSFFSKQQDTAYPSCEKGTDIIEKALYYMKSNYEQPLTLKDTAAYVQLNPSYFSTLFKQRCGDTFKEHLNLIRIEESKKLLLHTDYSILDIAVAVGFVDQSYFTKIFKKYTGKTPKGYRAEGK